LVCVLHEVNTLLFAMLGLSHSNIITPVNPKLFPGAKVEGYGQSLISVTLEHQSVIIKLNS